MAVESKNGKQCCKEGTMILNDSVWLEKSGDWLNLNQRLRVLSVTHDVHRDVSYFATDTQIHAYDHFTGQTSCFFVFRGTGSLRILVILCVSPTTLQSTDEAPLMLALCAFRDDANKTEHRILHLNQYGFVVKTVVTTALDYTATLAPLGVFFQKEGNRFVIIVRLHALFLGTDVLVAIDIDLGTHFSIVASESEYGTPQFFDTQTQQLAFVKDNVIQWYDMRLDAENTFRLSGTRRSLSLEMIGKAHDDSSKEKDDSAKQNSENNDNPFFTCFPWIGYQDICCVDGSGEGMGVLF